MSYLTQVACTARCEWGLAGVEQLATAEVIIIVDVLSFSTCVDIAVNRGATVLPYRWKDETALVYAREQNAELAGGRNRFESRYSLAPSSLVNVPAGLRLVLPSPNGSTLAFYAQQTGAKVVAGCLRNASAMARWANAVGGSVNVIPAGERWPDGSLRFALEDWLGAGAILQHLHGDLSPEAQAAVTTFTGMRADLHRSLLHSVSGMELEQRGFIADVELAAAIDTSNAVPLLTREGFVSA